MAEDSAGSQALKLDSGDYIVSVKPAPPPKPLPKLPRLSPGERLAAAVLGVALALAIALS